MSKQAWLTRIDSEEVEQFESKVESAKQISENNENQIDMEIDEFLTLDQMQEQHSVLNEQSDDEESQNA